MKIELILTADEVSFIKDIVSEAHDDYSTSTCDDDVIAVCDKVLKALENGVPDDNEQDIILEALDLLTDNLECEMGEFSNDSVEYQEAKAKYDVANKLKGEYVDV